MGQIGSTSLIQFQLYTLWGGLLIFNTIAAEWLKTVNFYPIRGIEGCSLKELALSLTLLQNEVNV